MTQKNQCCEFAYSPWLKWEPNKGRSFTLLACIENDTTSFENVCEFLKIFDQDDKENIVVGDKNIDLKGPPLKSNANSDNPFTSYTV